ncbi:MAG: DUF1376 domain-containing protein [Geobacter sp.]|nr:DUF1376 domain-containing protein [Geobacter sp.]
MALPYFPLYPKDLLTDDRTAELTTEELGLWLIVLCRMWIAENELADDDDRLCRVLRIDLETWQSLKQRLLANGLLRVDDGHLLNNRLTYEFMRICSKSEQSKRAAFIKAEKAALIKAQKSQLAVVAPLSGRESLEEQVEQMKAKDMLKRANA